MARPKGTPNKRSQTLQAELFRLGVSLPDRIMELIKSNKSVQEGGLSDRDKLHAYLELLQYIYPKRKAIEFETIPGTNEAKEIIYEATWQPLPGNG